MNTEHEGLTPELEELIEDSRTNWVPAPVGGAEFHDSVRRRIRRRNTRNAALAACAVAALVAGFLGALRGDSSPAPVTPQQIAEVVPEPAATPPAPEPGEVVTIAEGNLPDLSSPDRIEPWFHQALVDNVPLTGLASEYGALGALYLGERGL